ncbi:MAG TPA: hypothetical protein VNP03_13175 [Pseudonocardia sp.]|nr:hypothetical protein [Pseudonocardia sp.]
MWTFWMIIGLGFLLFLAFQAGQSADATRERHLRQRTADEVRRLAEERKWLAAERDRYVEAARAWREAREERDTRRAERVAAGHTGAPTDDDDQPPGGTPLAA